MEELSFDMNWPLGQEMQRSEAGRLEEPFGQDLQAAREVAAVVLLNVLDLQGRQEEREVEPRLGLKVPTGQGVQRVVEGER